MCGFLVSDSKKYDPKQCVFGCEAYWFCMFSIMRLLNDE